MLCESPTKATKNEVGRVGKGRIIVNTVISRGQRLAQKHSVKKIKNYKLLQAYIIITTCKADTSVLLHNIQDIGYCLNGLLKEGSDGHEKRVTLSVDIWSQQESKE